MPYASDVVILIPSRNRPDDLERTVTHMLPLTGDGVRLVIADDASTQHRQLGYLEELRANVDKVTVMCLRPHQGCTGTRMEALRQIRAKYAIILDDDAHFMEPHLDLVERVVERFEREPHLAVQAFPVYVPYRGWKIDEVVGRRPDGSLTSSFINSGCALRLSAFWEVGGYRSEFESPYVEEKDLSLRLMEAGWLLRYFQSPRIVHYQTPVERDDERNLRGFTLNSLRLQWWYHPAWLAALNSTRALSTTLVQSSRARRSIRAIVLGVTDFMRDVPNILRARQTVSPRTLKAYYSLRRHHPMQLEELEALAIRPWMHVLRDVFVTQIEDR